MCHLGRIVVAFLAASAQATSRENIWNAGHKYVFDISGYGTDAPPKKIILIDRSGGGINDNEWFYINSNRTITWASNQHDQTQLCLTAESTQPAADLQLNYCSWVDGYFSYADLQQWKWNLVDGKGYNLQLYQSPTVCAFVGGTAQNAQVQMGSCSIDGSYWSSSSSFPYPVTPSPTPAPSPSPAPGPSSSNSSTPIIVIVVVGVVVLVCCIVGFAYRRQTSARQVRRSNSSIDPLVGTAISPTSGKPATSGPKKSRRGGSRNRFADGVDKVALDGARQFFPQGWAPDCEIDEALNRFGTNKERVRELQSNVAQKMEFLKSIAAATLSLCHTTAIMAYTEENDALYPPLNKAMRMYNSDDQKKLQFWLSYVYFLDRALTTLPTFAGTTFRGIKVRIDSTVYTIGRTITWQQFSSSTKDPMVTLEFLHNNGQAVSGTLFVISSQSGKEISEYSLFPEEDEVLFTFNSHFKVLNRCTNQEQKRKLVPEFGAYDVEALEVYHLQQL